MYCVSLADLRNMKPEDRDRELTELVRRATEPRNGQTAALTARIHAYEERYEISSKKMLQELVEGRRQETADISKWLFWVKAAGGE
jgi:hypothetical protein